MFKSVSFRADSIDSTDQAATLAEENIYHHKLKSKTTNHQERTAKYSDTK